MLTQIAPRAGFDDLERAVLEVQPLVTPAVLVVMAERSGASGGLRLQAVAALQFGVDTALTLTDGTGAPARTGVGLAARDRATGLTVYRTPGSALTELKPWTPTQAFETFPATSS